MTKIILVRHGETVWNKELRYQGHRDIPLSDVGRQQAQKLRDRLAGETIDAFYASDLSRALETARIAAVPHGREVLPVPELRETNFGLWEGLTYNEIVTSYGEEMKRWREDPLANRIPGGETLTEVAERCMKSIHRIIAGHPDQTVLIAAHGGTIRLVVGSVLGLDLKSFWKIKQDNVAVNVIEFYNNNRAIVCLLNDTGHLTCIE
jgi:alpha-ribazole phosphatase